MSVSSPRRPLSSLFSSLPPYLFSPLQRGCVFEEFSKSSVTIYFTSYLLVWLFSLILMVTTLGFLLYYLLPVDPHSGTKQIPGKLPLLFLGIY